MNQTKQAIGIALGASTLSFVRVKTDGTISEIVDTLTLPHYGNPRAILQDKLNNFNPDAAPVVATGRKYRHFLNLKTISEPEAVETAFAFVNREKKEYSAIASLGGETFLVYSLDSEGKIANLYAKNQCASGTGEFFLQQIGRMDLQVVEAIEMASFSEPYKVSGRCSVFCKSDCTHALNKGVTKGSTVAGLAEMMADKIAELLKKAGEGRILLTGGVTQNALVMKYLLGNVDRCEIPQEASYFEALGAALYSLVEFDESYNPAIDIFSESKSSFEFHEPLGNFVSKVDFKEFSLSSARENDKCILGVDVGSTTTKAVLMRQCDCAVLASVYLYTHGDPIAAARSCYKRLADDLNVKVDIIGLGVTGSGRHITALHALSDGIVNEITAHATAAIYFDPEVDTIFEIGGQDAKYTYITNRIPADYAMNEACSAGTGSFIEEAARESFSISTEEIEWIAFAGENPPNFSDQCAAFINSDIKTASGEGLSREDIVAGLVYSICMNYINRVKGARPIGKKIFMQGGVCYNKAIPVAMAALTGKDITVPPEPGLLGAYGVALCIKERLELGIIKESIYDLNELAMRDVTYHDSFSCNGGSEKCDLACSINLIEVRSKKYPFGGACDRYSSISSKVQANADKYDLVKLRNNLLFNEFAPKLKLSEKAKTIGLNASFHTYTLFPLYYNFFSQLGLHVVMPDKPDYQGLEREYTSFCYPAQLSLCYFEALMKLKTDYIFIPNVHEMYCEPESERQRLDFNCSCVFISGEPYYLQQAFKYDINPDTILSPTVNFASGYAQAESQFIEIGTRLGFSEKESSEAYRKASAMQNQFESRLKAEGRRVIDELGNNPNAHAIVLLGRTYNAFANVANKSIPQKIASRGVYVIPYDMLDYISETIDDNQYWEGAKKILKSAKIVKRNDKLFAFYITNFSCGPDSMTLPTFRSIMGEKPSLTLELDGHTADAGINTRIDAAFDIINNYIRLNNSIKLNNDFSLETVNRAKSISTVKKENARTGVADRSDDHFRPATIEFGTDSAYFVTSGGEKLPLTDDRVEILIPSMGDLAANLFAAGMRGIGFNAIAMNEGSNHTLKKARAVATGKECLPILLCAGALLDYLERRKDKTKYVAFFIVQGAGNCRLGQYPVFLRDIIKKMELRNVATFVLMNEDGFAGLGPKFAIRGIQTIIASDVLDDIRSAVMAHAIDPDFGMKVFDREFKKLLKVTEESPKKFYKALAGFSKAIKEKIPSSKHISEAKYIALLGEIYVRRDHFAHKWLNRRFAKEGFIVKDAYISEWIYYVDYLLKRDLLEPLDSFKLKYERLVRIGYMRYCERRIKKTLEHSGYYKYMPTKIDPLLNHSKHIVPLEFKGEPGLTLGISLHESLEKYCGIINMGPFGCMPTRFSEAVTVPEMNVENKLAIKQKLDSGYTLSDAFAGNMPIPFLTLESDGNVYPQVIEARLEAFTLQARRVAEKMELGKNGGKKKIKNNKENN